MMGLLFFLIFSIIIIIIGYCLSMKGQLIELKNLKAINENLKLKNDKLVSDNFRLRNEKRVLLKFNENKGANNGTK